MLGAEFSKEKYESNLIIILASLGGKFIKTAYGLIQLIGLARPKFDVLPQADDFDLTQVDPN